MLRKLVFPDILKPILIFFPERLAFYPMGLIHYNQITSQRVFQAKSILLFCQLYLLICFNKNYYYYYKKNMRDFKCEHAWDSATWSGTLDQTLTCRLCRVVNQI